MPIFMVEREFAEIYESSPTSSKRIFDYELENEIRWLTSFLSADKKKSYCLYEADDIELIRRHAADLGIPLDAIVEVTQLPPRQGTP